MTRLVSALLAAAAVLFLSVVLAGCAEERPAIDRVQPGALDKTFFVGADLYDAADNPEFWTQATLIDVGYGASQSGLFTSTYAQPMARLKWQITEELLIGRLSYERIDGTDGKGVGAKTDQGVIVVAFDIEDHFDITYAYNATTGEQLNIIEENSSDRPWYERTHMRVDFSKNLNVDSYDFDTLSLVGLYGGVSYESLAFDVEDPNSPEAPYFDTKNGYFDITSKAFAKPGVIDLSALGWGIDTFPSCFLDADFMSGTWPSGSCSPVELTIRHGFRRVANHDYAPAEWDGFRQQSYGAFTVERFGYAQNFGMVDDQWHRFPAKYAIWDRSHYYEDPEAMTGAVACFTPDTTPYGGDPHRDEDDDGTEDECAAVGNGSKCDTFEQKCTLPFQERTAHAIPWFYTSGSNPTYFEPTRWATHEWDVAMRAAVRTAKYAECQRVGGEDCAGRFPVWFGQQDENVAAVALAREVDDCRDGVAYAELDGDEAACTALADSIGAARGLSEGVISVAKMSEMVVLCHSPTEANDPEACGGPRLPASVTAAQCAAAEAAATDDVLLAVCRSAQQVRRGDLRFHQVNVMTEPQTPSPWGIYTDAEDPLTGETVSASINVWSHVNDLWSQGVVDILRYIEGELETSEITDGEYVRDWSLAAAAASGRGLAPRMDREEVERRMAEFARAPGQDAAAEADAPELDLEKIKTSAVYQATKQLVSEASGVASSVDAVSTLAPIYAARRAQAAGTMVEAELMTKAVQELNGIAGLPVTDGLMDLVSPLRGGNPTLQRQLRHLTENALAERGACVLHEAAAPLSLTALSQVMQQKFGAFDPTQTPDEQQARAEKMRVYLARRAHFAVVAHEMGHSIGLRHNFVSSSDAWGYRPQYWQLRTRDGAVDTPCEDLDANGANCVGPRFWDPITDDEHDNLMHMFMHSSVMDYAGEPTQDFMGLGAYDFAAARMFYGDVVAVHADESYAVGTPRGNGMLQKMDNFGGILGIQPAYGDEDIHYSMLQARFDLIQDCQPIDPQTLMPASYDPALDGEWHPTLDGLVVEVDGQYTQCRQQPVDYARWGDLRYPANDEVSGYFGGSVAVDRDNRVRVPYGFATDRWADLGNASVYRHDNGADTYEIFDFLMTQQEVGHIFDNYRRGRQGFSVRKASNRTLSRFNEKLRDGAKGLALFRNIYTDFALENGWNADGTWAALAPLFFRDQILSSGIVFDHFVRTAARPEPGPHFYFANEPSRGVLLSSRDTVGNAGSTQVTVPNGATGYYGDVAAGGKQVENALSNDFGEYDSDIVLNAGSYYDKMYAAMLMTESVDNFISSSRSDFVDARYRAVSLADLFPDGYRRWLANSLTGDAFLKGPRVATDSTGHPLLDADGYPAHPIGWTTWWGDTPEACFPVDGTVACESYGSKAFGVALANNAPEHTAALDPQIGWEQHKFLIAWTLAYLPENQQQTWIDQLRIWELGVDADPGFENRIEFHHPSGKVYVAKTFGKEEIFGQTVQRGIAARILEYANALLVDAYEVSAGPDLDSDGYADWFIPNVDSTTGQVPVRWDSDISWITEESFISPVGAEGCNPTENYACTCAANRACMELSDYVSVPFFLRQSIAAYGIDNPSPKGVY